MQRIDIDDISDTRLDHYRSLRDRRLSEDHGLFICEGRRLTLRMIDSGYQPHSVCIMANKLDRIASRLPEGLPVYVLPNKRAQTELAGMAIHTGVLALAHRKPWPTLEALAQPTADDRPAMLMVAPQVKEAANLGALVRTAAAFGCTGLLLGPHCCDPFQRRALRVAMGTALRLPIRRAVHLLDELDRLRRDMDYQLIATVLDEDAEVLHHAPPLGPGDRAALLLGHEAEGLDSAMVDHCDRRMTIPMHLGTDSLNISVSAAVFAYHLLAPAKPIRLPEAADPATETTDL